MGKEIVWLPAESNLQINEHFIFYGSFIWIKRERISNKNPVKMLYIATS